MSITNIGHAFAREYTGLENSVSAQLSLIRLNVQRKSLAALLQLALSLKPAMEASKPARDGVEKLPTSTSEFLLSGQGLFKGWAKSPPPPPSLTLIGA